MCGGGEKGGREGRKRSRLTGKRFSLNTPRRSHLGEGAWAKGANGQGQSSRPAEHASTRYAGPACWAWVTAVKESRRPFGRHRPPMSDRALARKKQGLRGQREWHGRANAGTAPAGQLVIGNPCAGAHTRIKWQVPSGYSGPLEVWRGDLGAPRPPTAALPISRE